MRQKHKCNRADVVTWSTYNSLERIPRHIAISISNRFGEFLAFLLGRSVTNGAKNKTYITNEIKTQLNMLFVKGRLI